VHVLKISADCGCTSAKISNELIGPKADATLFVTSHVEGIIGQLPRRRVTLQTDAPISGNCVIELIGDRRKHFEVTPQWVDFWATKNDPLLTQQVLLRVNDASQPLDLTKIYASVPNLAAVAAAPKNLNESTWEIPLSITFDPRDAQSDSDARVMVPAAGGGRGVGIGIRTHVLSEIESLPATVFTSLHRNGERISRTISLRATSIPGRTASEAPIHIDGFASIPSGVHPTIIAETPYKILLDISTTELPESRADLIIKCRLGEGSVQLVHVPILEPAVQ
jgi:hypothetical protein